VSLRPNKPQPDYSVFPRRYEQKERRPAGPPSLRILFCGLDAFNVLGLPSFGAFDYVELNLLALLQAAKPVCLNGGEVHEYIFTILAADKTLALGVVKPFYCSCFHDVAVFLLC
jgi:hypothetical protein